MKKMRCILGVTFIFVTMFLVQPAVTFSTSPKPITIKSACFLPINHVISSFVPVIVEKINAACKGQVDWKILGGPEVVPGLDQFEAVKRGTLGAAFVVAGDYAGHVPEAYSAALSRLEPWEERKSNFYESFKAVHLKQNVYYIGRWHKMGFYIWTNKPVEKMADLKGRKIRGGGTLYDPWFEKLGITGVQIPYPDVYTALQRGVVDGFAWPMFGASDAGWLEVTKNCIDHEVFSSSDGVIIVNKKLWDKIPKKVQGTIEKIIADAEHDMVTHYEKAYEQEKQKALKAGVKFVKLPADEAKKYVDYAYEGGWSFVKKNVSPEQYNRLQKVLTK
jgi:TRAP-type C4-dicarboxylate transport system substrate-binding protein